MKTLKKIIGLQTFTLFWTNRLIWVDKNQGSESPALDPELMEELEKMISSLDEDALFDSLEPLIGDDVEWNFILDLPESLKNKILEKLDLELSDLGKAKDSSEKEAVEKLAELLNEQKEEQSTTEDPEITSQQTETKEDVEDVVPEISEEEGEDNDVEKEEKYTVTDARGEKIDLKKREEIYINGFSYTFNGFDEKGRILLDNGDEYITNPIGYIITKTFAEYQLSLVEKEEPKDDLVSQNNVDSLLNPLTAWTWENLEKAKKDGVVFVLRNGDKFKLTEVRNDWFKFENIDNPNDLLEFSFSDLGTFNEFVSDWGLKVYEELEISSEEVEEPLETTKTINEIEDLIQKTAKEIQEVVKMEAEYNQNKEILTNFIGEIPSQLDAIDQALSELSDDVYEKEGFVIKSQELKEKFNQIKNWQIMPEIALQGQKKIDKINIQPKLNNINTSLEVVEQDIDSLQKEAVSFKEFTKDYLGKLGENANFLLANDLTLKREIKQRERQIRRLTIMRKRENLTLDWKPVKNVDETIKTLKEEVTELKKLLQKNEKDLTLVRDNLTEVVSDTAEKTEGEDSGLKVEITKFAEKSTKIWSRLGETGRSVLKKISRKQETN